MCHCRFWEIGGFWLDWGSCIRSGDNPADYERWLGALATANRMFGDWPNILSVRVSYRLSGCRTGTAMTCLPAETATSCLCPPKRSDKCIGSQNGTKGDMVTSKNLDLLPNTK